jgi:hypothetical protein
MDTTNNRILENIRCLPENEYIYESKSDLLGFTKPIQKKTHLKEFYTVNHRYTNSYNSESSTSGDMETESIASNICTPTKRIPRTFMQTQKLRCANALALILSSPLLLCLLTIALIKTIKIYLQDLIENNRPHDNEVNSQPDELVTNSEIYYAEKWGYKSERHHVVTKDGYILSMYRLSKKSADPKGKY